MQRHNESVDDARTRRPASVKVEAATPSFPAKREGMLGEEHDQTIKPTSQSAQAGEASPIYENLLFFVQEADVLAWRCQEIPKYNANIEIGPFFSPAHGGLKLARSLFGPLEVRLPFVFAQAMPGEVEHLCRRAKYIRVGALD
jgi:hypothetical protein